MAVLLTLAVILRVALRIYTYFLWARLIIEWIKIFKPGFRPRGFGLLILELVFTLTDPPIKFFRKILPPIRLGNVMLDLGWMITMLACLILISVLS